MAAEVSSDVTFINDEDVLRRMWQQTEDFGRKKEIRARMYKLREQRLREFYTTGEVVNETMTSRKYTGTTHADSISDQGFLTMKTKEIRDSESPTRDIQRRTCDNNYWNTVQESSYSTGDDANTLSDSYTLTTTGQGITEDGKTKMNLAAQEKGFQSASIYEDDTSKTASEQKGLTTEVKSSSHTKTDNGESMSTSTSKQHQEQKSSKVVSTNNDSSFSSSKWETSSSSSSSRRIVSSSSNYEVTGNEALTSDIKAITSDDTDFYIDQLKQDTTQRDTNEFDQSSRARNVIKNTTKSDTYSKNFEVNEQNSSSFIDNEIRSETNDAIIHDHRHNDQIKNVDKKTYKTELTSTVQDYNTEQDAYTNKATRKEYTKPEVENVVVDQKIMTELQKLDSFLSTQNTGTSTPVSPHSVTSDVANWTVVSSTDGEFVYRGDKITKVDGKVTEPQQPKRELIKQPSSLDLPKDTTDGQYVTTYQEHYTNKRISVDNSPTHDAFARSLRQSPPPSSRSSSKASLDRSSPERKHKTSPRASPDKERRVSVGSYTVEKPKESPKRKTSDVLRQTNTTKDTKTKRKFSTTQTKAASKTRASTPGASPETSPTRQQRGRTTSPSSQSDSDASQVTYDKTDSTTIKRTDITRRKLVESFNDENILKSLEDSEDVKQISRPSQDIAPIAKSPQETVEKKIPGILRKESKTDVDVHSDNVNSSEVIQNRQTSKINTVLVSNARLRTTSPEYSSEGSVGKEIQINRSPLKEPKQSPDSSPERSGFAPIKCFRTSPEVNTVTQEININVHHFDMEGTVHKPRDEREPTKPETPISTRKQSTPDSGMQSPNSDIVSRRTPSPGKTTSPIRRESTPTKQDTIKKSPSPSAPISRRPSSPEKKMSPTRTAGQKTTEITIKRATSPTKEDRPSVRPLSPSKEDHFKKTEHTKKSEIKTRPQSPKKEVSSRKPSIPKQEPQQNKGVSPVDETSPKRKYSPSRRSSSPQKEDFTRRPHLSEKSPSPVRRSFSPKKDDFTRRQKSPEKDSSPNRRTTSPTKEVSPRKINSPERFSKSSSVSPCSSPERPSDRKVTSINISPVRKSTPQKPSDRPSDESKPQEVRTTRRSSIPRADQTTTVIRKTFDNKVEVRTKPVSKIPSSIERRSKPGQSPQTHPNRTNSQSSIDKQTTIKNYKTTVRQTVEKPREIVKKAPVKTVKTTAIITIQKPTTPTSQLKKTTTNTVTRVSQTIKKATPKDTTPTKFTNTNKKPLAEKIPSQQINTKRTPTNTSPKTKQTDYDNSLSDRSSLMSSPETVRPSEILSINQEHTIGFIERLRQDEITQDDHSSNVALSFICGNENMTNDLSERTVNIEFIRNNIEDETLPEGLPDTEYEDESPKVVKNNVNEISEKTFNVEGKRQTSNTFTVTVKKPTGPTRPSTAPKTSPSNRNVSTRSSSGPIKPSQGTSRPTTPAKKTAPINKTETFSRSASDKTVIKNTTTKRQTSKPELNTVKLQTSTNKINSSKQITETGIATRSVTTAKSATIKRSTSPKKKITETKHDVTSTSSSEDEEDIPSVVTTNDKEQSYIEELEEIRRAEELEYASKVTATTNKENMLLNVIVQHPKSSRESSPDYSNRGQPFCAVSDDGGSHPRLADMVIEPEDVEVFDKHNFNKPAGYTAPNERSFEQITDLDEESELEDLKLNVSVADRVSQFIETTKNINATTVREEPCAPVPSDGPKKSVLKAKNMFENIAKNQMAPPAPNNKPVDILNRPSIFEARRGEIAPKNINSDTFPRRRGSKSPEQIQRRSSFEDVSNVDDELLINVEENTEEFTDSVRTATLNETKPIHSTPDHSPVSYENIESTVFDNKVSITNVNEYSTPKKTTKEPQQKETPIRKQSQERKAPVDTNIKTSERTVTKTSNEISSKKAFFERKAQAQVTTSTKETFKRGTPQKNPEFKNMPKETSPDRKSVQTDFIDNERRSSRTYPDRKTSVPTIPTKEQKPSIKSNSPDRKESPLAKTKETYDETPQKKLPSRKDSPERNFSRANKERKESPERQVPTAPLKERKDTPASFTSVKDRKPSFTRDSPERTTVQDKKSNFPRESPERILGRDKPVFNRDSPDRSFIKDKTSPISRESPERSQVKDRKPSIKRESPERTVVKDRRPSASRESPERSPVKDRRPSTNRESPERTPVKDRRPSANRESPERTPVKDRRPSVNRESPERSPVKDRRPSTNRESPERTPVKDRRPLANRESPERTPVKDRRPLANRESPERTSVKDRRTSINRDSPDRSPTKERRTSLNRESPRRETEVPELNKAGKFGVTLRRTSSTGSGCTTRRPSIPGEPQEIEEIFELELLEQLMEKAVGYEQRRRIRSQIRIVKKTQEDKVTKNYKSSVTTRSGPKTPTRLDSPTREPSAKSEKTPLKVQQQSKPTEEKYSPTVHRPASPTKNVRGESPEPRRSSDTKPLTNGYHKPDRKDTSPGRKSPQNFRKQDSSPQRTETTVRRGSKTETNVEITTVRTQKRTETLQEKGVDSITSSYGVGPTDEKGRPLFGLKALRRSNTNKTFTDEPEEPAVIEREPEPEVCDARGRPLFGLKALQTSIDIDDMPEQPATPQLKDLVLRHEKKTKDNSSEREPVHKPKAKLRDSFILQQEEDHKTNALEEFNSSQRGLSLRSIIQKHENIAQTAGTVKREMATSTTVVSSKSTVSSDGSVSLSRDVIQGELSSKNGEEPVGKMTRTEYTYKSPRLEDNEKAVSKVTTTTTQIGNRRLSGPKITEVEDDDNSKRKIKSISDRRTSIEDGNEEIIQKKTFNSSRRSSTQKDENETSTISSISTRRFSGQKIIDDLENGDDIDESEKNKVYGGKSVTTSTVTSNVRRFSSPKIIDDDNEDIIQRKSSSRVSSTTTTTSTRRTDSPQSRSKMTNSVTKQTSKDEEDLQSAEEKKKGLVRGDSVRALQHKFQQATETAVNQTQKNYPRAGLILRTSSFKTADEHALLSSKQKQTTDKNRQSPDKSSPSVRNQTTESTVSRSSRVSETADSGTTVESNLRTTTTSRVTESSSTTTNSNSSFLDNNTRVTGVQDILNRMRNADLVVESDDTCEDTEARALLNKFLGASVILQGMEQGMKAAGQTTEITDITPGSAALVSKVEKQRMATTTRKQEEDIENIWDEKQLRILLEACSDYEGRRQIRARLRTVMAEHKACADVVAVTGQDHGSSALSQGECALVLPSSLMRSQSSQSSCVDDSGTESGEDFRLLSPEILAEVQRALTRLEGALPGLDPVRREALIQLVNRLQSCLKLQPPNPPPPHPPPRRFAKRLSRQNRHTVGVSKEELADARKWLQEAGLDPIDTSVLDLAQFHDKKSSNSLSNLSTQNVSVVSKVFRPVIFNPNTQKPVFGNNIELSQEVPNQVPIVEQEYSQPKLHRSSVDYVDEPIPLAASLSFNGEQRELPVMKADSGSSLLEYDPSLTLFTPAQSVQIAVHKAAINKQISQEESKRERKNMKENSNCYESDDGDISSTEEEQTLIAQEDLDECVSSAQRLLQIATDNQKKRTPERFHAKNSKKLKMKRANTIDIPKPCFYDGECSSGEEFERTSADEVQNDNEKSRVRASSGDRKYTQIPFQPKTESDMKFLAFLQQTKNDNYKTVTYNPSARGGKPWSNRFTNIKTAFEQPVSKENNPVPPKKSVTPVNQQWPLNTNSEQPILRQAVQNRSPQPLQTKLPWTEQDQGNGVVFGSIMVAKKTTGLVNQFSHAPKSAFKPIEKKPVTPSYQPTPSGTVKQLVTNTFSGNNVPTKPVVKHYPTIQDKTFNSQFIQNQPGDSSSMQYNQAYKPKQSYVDPSTVLYKQKQPKVISNKKPNEFIEQYSPLHVKQLDTFIKKSEAQMNDLDNVLGNEEERGGYDGEYMDYPVTNNKASKQHFSSSSATAHRHYGIPSYQSGNHYKTPKNDDPDISEYSPPKQYIYSPPTKGKAYSNPPQFDMVSNNQENQKFVPQSPQKIPHTPPEFKSGTVTYPISKNIEPYISHGMGKIQNVPYQNKVVHSPVTYNNTPSPVLRDGYPSTVNAMPSEYQSSWQQPPLQQASPYSPHPPVKVKTITPIVHNLSQDSDQSPTLNPHLMTFPDERNQSEYYNSSSPSGVQCAISPYLYDDSNNSSFVPSPLAWNKEEEEEIETRSSPDGLEMQTAITKVMGHAQCQQAVTVVKRTKHRYDDDGYKKDVTAAKKLGSELRLSVASKSKSPSPFNNDKVETESLSQMASKTSNQFSQAFRKLEAEQRLKEVVPQVEHKKVKPSSLQNQNTSKSMNVVTNNAAKKVEIEARLQVPIKSPASISSYKSVSTKLESSTHQIVPKSIIRTPNSSISPTKRIQPDHLRDSPKVPGSLSPSFPSVLQKSESWHQLVKEQIAPVKQPPPKSPRLPRAKSSHSLAFPKQFEASLTPDKVSVKQSTIDQYLKQTEVKRQTETKKQMVKVKEKITAVVKLDDDLENVEEAFESLFIEASKKSKSCESKQVMTKGEGSTVTRTEVHTRTVSSSNRLTKANSVTSPFAKFKQLERQNSVPSSGSAPLFKFTDPKLVRSASTIKERLLNWVQAQTKDYKNIQIDNFSTSWSNGLAFCALIHHFCPDAFDYDKLTPEQRRHNFELAFRVAEEEAGIAPLLDVEDMVVMRRPDWKCVFTYVQSIYRRYHSTPEAVRY